MDSEARPAADLAAFLRERRDEILSTWTQRVQALPVARNLPRPDLIDHLPRLLDRLASAIDRDGDEALVEGPATAHSNERAEEGFDLAEVVAEYSMLRASIMELWRLEKRGEAGLLRLHLAIDHAVSASVESFLAGEVQRARADADRAVAERDAFLQAAPVGVAFLDRELRYVRVNDTFAELVGRTSRELLGRRVAEIWPERREGEELIRQVIERGDALRNLEATHGERTLLVTLFPVRLHQRVAGVGALAMDISDRKRFEGQLADAVSFRDRFIGILAHDLRNPLQAIMMVVSRLIRSEGLREGHHRAIARIAASAHRMERMIADVVDFTRGRLGGGIPLSRRQVDLAHLLDSVIEELEVAQPGHAIHLASDGDTTGAWDPERLAQVASNLVTNALQHGAAGKPVDVRVSGRGDRVVLEVKNHGTPIPPELVGHIFEPFRRLAEPGEDRTRSRSLGLGLYIVKAIVEAHGGAIRVVSSADDGTSFIVELPRGVGLAS